MFQDLLPDLTALSPQLVLVTVFVLAFLETSLVVGVLLPGEVLIGACIGVLHVSWAPLAGIVAAVGCFTGQLTGYLIGRRWGPSLRTGWIGRRAGEQRWGQAERLVDQAGGRLLVTARFVSVAHTLAPLLAGALRMPLRKFAAFAGVGAVIWAGIWAVIGAVLSKAGESVDQTVLSGVLLLGGIVIAGVVTSRLLRKPARSGDGAQGVTQDGARRTAVPG